MPPSRGRKPNRAERRAAKSKGRPGTFRALSEAPDRTIAVVADACPHCDHALSAGAQPDIHAYDHIDLPPIQPVVTRVLRHRGLSLLSPGLQRAGTCGTWRLAAPSVPASWRS